MSGICDCELSHNGCGVMGRECDCPAGECTAPPETTEPTVETWQPNQWTGFARCE